MKVAIFAVLALVSGTMAGDDPCADCKEAVPVLGAYLLTPAEIAAVEQGLVDLVCTTLPEENIEECATGVYQRWPGVAEALFTWEGTVDSICMGVGLCMRKTPRTLLKHVRGHLKTQLDIQSIWSTFMSNWESTNKTILNL